jgi:hypothetical protein
MQPKERKTRHHLLLTSALLLAAIALVALCSNRPAQAQSAVEPHLGYGFNVAFWDITKVQTMGFDWIKVFGAPGDRLPVRVLIRVDANAANATAAGISALQAEVGALARNNGANIEAYEIGNEVNLDASYGWAAPPVAADYVRALCAAYEAIHANDPLATVVSAGLAPVGRVTGTWDGHLGHNGAYQDEREYLREFLAAGGAACADAIGYHPYGFSASYDAQPDFPSLDPDQNCANGFCFRGVEPFQAILAAAGHGDLPVWATEFGWIVRPPDDCLSHPTFQGREWQLVTEDEQAANLAGAFAFADANWPWMGPMFIFNLNFNVATWYETCEQMRYYAVQGRPAEAALTALPKNPVRGIMDVNAAPRVLLAATADQPLTFNFSIPVANRDIYAFTFEASAPGQPFPLVVSPSTGEVAGGATRLLNISATASALASGVHDAQLTMTGSPGVQGAPVTVPVRLYLLDDIERLYLPFVP